MKIVIISGGTGNDSLIKGLKSYYPSVDCKVIVNAYDNGKSTGVCRDITNTLGVSDIRKNHLRMYETINQYPNQNLIDFYENRYNLIPGKELEEVVNKLMVWNLQEFIPYAKSFFDREKSSDYQYNNFNISNIIYSELYAEKGYEYTNKLFCDKLGIDDFVVLNSFDNVFISAVTENGVLIDDEGKIVEWCNPDDKIVSIHYKNTSDTIQNLNENAIKLIDSADLIIISTGTFWSSIYPTIEYGNLYEYINKSKAKKIWAINCSQDKDSYSVSADEFICRMNNLGLDLNDFTLLFNKDAEKGLSDTLVFHDIKKYCVSMGNIDGKHCAKKFAKSIFEIYYDLQDFNIEVLVTDFDDTLWSRNNNDIDLCIDNIRLLNRYYSRINSIIISGNSIQNIKEKLKIIYKLNFDTFTVPIWCNASSTKFIEMTEVDRIDQCFIPEEDVYSILNYFKDNLSMVPFDEINGKMTSYIKFKPLNELERNLLVLFYNSFIRYYINCPDTIALKTGKSTVDIVRNSDNKSKVFDYLNLYRYNTLYIGDEIDSGNDYEISKKCTKSIHTSGVEETNCILKVVFNDIRNSTISWETIKI